MPRTWTDEEVWAYKSHTEIQLRKIVEDRDRVIIALENQISKAVDGTAILIGERNRTIANLKQQIEDSTKVADATD